MDMGMSSMLAVPSSGTPGKYYQICRVHHPGGPSSNGITDSSHLEGVFGASTSRMCESKEKLSDREY